MIENEISRNVAAQFIWLVVLYIINDEIIILKKCNLKIYNVGNLRVDAGIEYANKT